MASAGPPQLDAARARATLGDDGTLVVWIPPDETRDGVRVDVAHDGAIARLAVPRQAVPGALLRADWLA
mgnify:CR=1 FL=1